MDSKRIEPFRAYTVQEASDLIGSSERAMIAKIRKGDIPGKYVGKGYKVLGENLLKYLGSPTILTQEMQLKKTTGIIPDKEAQLEMGSE